MKTDLARSEDQGIVYSRTMGTYRVRTGERELTCTAAASLRGGGTGRGDPVAVGDVVRVAPAPDEGGTIVEILPRRNTIARRGAVPRPGAHAFEQVIVANVDQLVPVFAAANPTPKWNLLDRYLALAESMGLPALVCVTKADLMTDGGREEVETALEEYRGLGYQVSVTSATTGAGLEEVRAALDGRVSVLLGKSGVGKTTLLNALEPALGLRVAEVSRATGKGRHTTTQTRLFPLANGALMDTPGTREFGLWDIAREELALCFREMRPWVGKCKFGLDCRHDEEPGCAIREAVMRGEISPRRYQSYMKLCEEV